MNNIGFFVARLNNMVRDLNKLTASSFVDDGDVYKLVTDIMVEANHIRELTDEKRGLVFSMDDGNSRVHFLDRSQK